MNSVTVDGLVYGEHMIRALEIELKRAKAEHTKLLAERDAMQSLATQATRERDAAIARAEKAEQERDEARTSRQQLLAELGETRAIAHHHEARAEAAEDLARRQHTALDACLAERDASVSPPVHRSHAMTPAEREAVELARYLRLTLDWFEPDFRLIANMTQREMVTAVDGLLALAERCAKLEAAAVSFIDAFERAERHNETRGMGGQHVPFHGEFCSAPPSVMGQLRRFAREMKAALDAKEHQP